ncbi:hypothetical protein A2276_08290 [candidate division WOR-1 bacterium RIFOXYA12_FULL_43_27]|uniref:Nitroreductase domain-containing protein n=1 Tax=candidate division WOR-1 bacterium RIFOXYC2_FULL_46_14 TaxID=1802587 RepID=A0A1F4U655_UNCSA|nr:MAG: hypothetical protein A2276_08290 [candidate division WOR-1 bacterium RIFOXYA12_FULL_43_27]OGC20593.1 MAG: hypothetical protein A2292_06115 [candidate division WOR-1 bacterium RIFOXYB2_FULL_46_45]OGC31670.1 MAG: hypothetical protein A2232_05335 [candidate division WOR-1 bacterium RIFOXYA2_FULL_46_56]OGC40434.1 MAG: hypothetical protein A2438_04145 [candidate division WOR-1 bacterium RIFOXYC2_FULL_46_14]
MKFRALVCLVFVFLLIAPVFAEAPKEIKLPEPQVTGKMSVEEALSKRRSCRSYYPNELSPEQVSQLLWAGQGITEKVWGWRTAPSAGAIYPITLFLVNKDGAYEYFPRWNKLKLVAKDDKRPGLTRCSLGQSFIGEAPVSIVVAAEFDKNKKSYGGVQGTRYTLLEAGHVAQNIHLQATALGLASIPVGTFWDSVAQSCLNLPKNLIPVYIIPIGYSKE